MSVLKIFITSLLFATVSFWNFSAVCAEQYNFTVGEHMKKTTSKKAKISKALKTNVSLSKKFVKLSKEEYAKALQHPKWQKKRLKIFERDKWKCKGCDDTETTLHVHHLKYTKKYPWNEPQKNLITYCSRCHAKAHNKKGVL